MTGRRLNVLGGGRPGVSLRAVAAGVVFALAACGYLAWALAAGWSGDGGAAQPPAHYPLRADRLVLSVPTEPPAGPAPPGKLDDVVAGFDALPGGKTLDPAGLDPGAAAAVAAALEELFGTPAEPRALAGSAVSAAELVRGRRLYADQCQHCHGLTGDGRGFGAAFLYPHPRDFRAGLFACADGSGKPTPARLKRVLREGVPGTPMPMFDLIPDADVDALVGVVQHLSGRGEVEARLLRGLLGDEADLTAADVPAAARVIAAGVAVAWVGAKDAPDAGIEDGPPDAAAVRRGRAVYAANGCAQCHGADGKGGAYRYDVWGGAVRPADLTRPPSEFKWGRRAGDWAGHVRGGVLPVGMPGSPHLSDGDVRDAVRFVRGLSLGALPADVRERLGPGGTK